MTRPVPYLHPMTVRGRIGRPQPKGLPLINLGYNELPYGASPRVAAAMAATPSNSYGPPTCDPVRDALAQAHGLDADNIICGNGSEELLDVIARVFVRPKDEILVSQYGYIQFEMTAHRLGAGLVKAAETNFTTDVDAILGSVTPATKLVFLANPNNPTGTVVPVEDLDRLANGLRSDVVLVLDLAYGEFTGADYCASVHALKARHENIVVTRTFSKAFGLAGLRVGWADAPAWMIPSLYAARGMGSVNAMAQAAAVAAVEDMETVVSRIAETVTERNRIATALSRLGVVALPSGTNFLAVMIEGQGADVAEALVEYLFDEGGFIVNRTREAGLEHFLRFSVGTPAQNDALLACIGAFMAKA